MPVEAALQIYKIAKGVGLLRGYSSARSRDQQRQSDMPFPRNDMRSLINEYLPEKNLLTSTQLYTVATEQENFKATLAGFNEIYLMGNGEAWREFIEMVDAGGMTPDKVGR